MQKLFILTLLVTYSCFTKKVFSQVNATITYLYGYGGMGIKNKPVKLFVNNNKVLFKELRKDSSWDVNNDGFEYKMETEYSYQAWYFDMKNKEIILEKKFSKNDHIMVISKWKAENLGWKITNKTKKIGKYTVKKATLESSIENGFGGKSLVEAWFTTDIALPIGPYKYYGLPGLIISLEIVGQGYFDFKSIKYDNAPEIKIPTKGINIPKKRILISNYPEDLIWMKKQIKIYKKRRN